MAYSGLFPLLIFCQYLATSLLTPAMLSHKMNARCVMHGADYFCRDSGMLPDSNQTQHVIFFYCRTTLSFSFICHPSFSNLLSEMGLDAAYKLCICYPHSVTSCICTNFIIVHGMLNVLDVIVNMFFM